MASAAARVVSVVYRTIIATEKVKEAPMELLGFPFL